LIFPGWVNEGGAEWFEARALGKRGLSSAEAMTLSRVAQQGALFPVQALNVQSFARMEGQSARLAYLQSYALIDYLVRKFGIRKLQNFYAELIRSRNLDRALERVYRMDSGALEQRFLAEVI
jgi:hypothetical protein